MENLYVESIVEKISNGIDEVIRNDSYIGRKIAIYGMDNLSFAIQSLLLNRNMTADYYVSYDNLQVMEGRRRIKGFSSRYLKKADNVIEIAFVKELKADETVILSAHFLSSQEREMLKNDGFVINKNYFQVYNREDDSFEKNVKGKKKVNIYELQKLEKEILREFDRFCLTNGLRYWVCGGTLLGTIRHKGFIPWDDDIDVFMPWNDYQRFVHSYIDNGAFRVASMDKQQYVGNYKTIWGKMVENTTIIREDDIVMQEIHPAWIDIFPIIGMPSDKEQQINLLREVVEIERKFTENFYRSNGSIAKRNQTYSDVVGISQRYDFDKAEYVGVIGTQYREKDIVSRSVFEKTGRMPFEDIEVNVPVGYEEYLRNLYGINWMEIPDESKRKVHKLEAYWI